MLRKLPPHLRLAGSVSIVVAGLLSLGLVHPVAAQQPAVQPGIEPLGMQPPGNQTLAEQSGPNVPAEALVTSIPTKNLLDVIQDGGPLMIPIAVCSVILLVFVFERVISLRRGRVIPGPFVRRFLEQIAEQNVDREEALQLCEENRSPVSEVFAAAVRKWGKPSVEVEQAVIDSGERVNNQLRRYLRVFNGVSTVTPLMGLLGTVLGMIRAFNAIVVAGAMGRPELLAAGISQALLTTAAGLSVAIPALILYLYFTSRVDRMIMDIDGYGQRLVELISAEGIAERAAGQAKSKSKRSKAA